VPLVFFFFGGRFDFLGGVLRILEPPFQSIFVVLYK
jgi:hypothetical protein